LKELNHIKTIYDSTPQPVMVADAAFNIVYQNDYCNLHVTSFETGRQTLISVLQQFANGTPADQLNNNAIYCGNRMFSFSFTQLDTYYLMTGVDVTGIVHDRDFYRECLDNLPADIGVFSPDGTYRYVNPTGIRDKSLRLWMIGKTDFDYCRYRGRDISMAEERRDILKKIVSSKTEHSYEEEISREGMETNWQLRKLSPVFDDDGEVKFILGYGLNIRERKKAEMAQKQALQLIEKTAKAKEEFVAVMSHEIRTPMNAIIGMSRLLSRTTLSDDQRKFLDAILTASGNLIVIVNDILDFSKIEAGKLRLENAGFTITEVTEYVKAVTLQQAEEKGLQLSFEMDQRIAPILIGDIYRINQVVVNIVNNAIKFTEKGNVDVRFVLEEDLPDAQYICIEVQDTGIGMTEEFMKEMFTMYTQEVGVTRKYGGTGLGLKITSQLVELMNGLIKVESKKNEGSLIRISLSLAKGTIHDIPGASNARYPSDALEGKNILIAEDNTLNILLVTTVLHNYGAKVLTADNGEKAIHILKNEPGIDAVLMDVEMPVMDGIEATLIIRKELSATLPIIALTANVMTEDRKKLAAAGMSAFISKPFSEDELVGIILKNIQ